MAEIKNSESDMSTQQKAELDKEKRKEESNFVLQLQIPGETKIPGTNLKICCTISGENEKNSAKAIPQKSYTKCFDYDIIKSSLCVRYRRPGDYFTIDGEGKKKKLKSYFIDKKNGTDSF